MNSKAVKARVRRKYRRWVVATLKGGVGKTTTAMGLAVAMVLDGEQVVVVCADTTNRGSTKWVRRAITNGYTIPFTFIQWMPDSEHPADLKKFLDWVADEYPDAQIVVDMGGEQAGQFVKACMWADWLISPVEVGELDLEGIGSTYEAAADISDLRAEAGRDLAHSVVLTCVPKARQGKARTAREQLMLDLRDDAGRPNPDQAWSVGVHVHEVEITRHNAYMDMSGTVPASPAELGEYDELYQEIKTLMAEDDEPQPATIGQES